jgi:hypothetical protein
MQTNNDTLASAGPGLKPASVLNLRVADVYAKHGLGFLRTLQASLPFRTVDTWTTESVLRDLERIAPGFQPWADELSNLRRVESRARSIRHRDVELDRRQLLGRHAVFAQERQPARVRVDVR